MATAGFASIWLGIDANQWPQALLHPVRYRDSLPQEWHERFTCDLLEMRPLQKQRLMLAQAEAPVQIRIAGLAHALVRLPLRLCASFCWERRSPPIIRRAFWPIGSKIFVISAYLWRICTQQQRGAGSFG